MIKYTPESWFTMLFRLQGSVFPRLLVRIIIGLLISLLVILIHRYYYPIQITTTIHKLIAVALGLLLVFRTNASYDRYWAGWRLVGELAYYTQDLFRKYCVYLSTHSLNQSEKITDHEEIQLVLSHLKVLQKVALLSIEDNDDDQGLDQHLSTEQIAYLRTVDQSFKFSIILSWTSEIIHQSGTQIPAPLKASLDSNLSHLGQVMIEMKRIQQTPIPFAYAQHLKIFLVIFCYTLPFALVSQMGWWTIIASGISTFALFGIDEIGVEIEDPFGDDPNDLPIADTLQMSEDALDQIYDCLDKRLI